VIGLGAQQLGRLSEPGFDARAFSPFSATASMSSCVRGMQLAGLFLHEQRDRHAPGALARDAPVRAILDHAGDALLAPGRGPLRFADVAQRMRAQILLVHADEPLRRGAENHGRLVPPAMRVAVSERHVMHQATTLFQQLDDDRVGLVDLQAGYERCAA
jgi:hypothetical protein